MSGASGCPSEDELARMVEGALGGAALASIEAHAARCERCAAVIAGLGTLERSAGAGASGGAAAHGPGLADRRAVGRYQLDRRIASGGMGEVWAAWDPQLRREIAVKLVRPERADDGRERERLLREARALARLGHPNVLAVHDVGELDGGEVFIATELVAGETLASRGGPSASWRDLVRLYTQAARGLAAAHAAGLVHRDVKPANLLLGLDGRVRVADFGLAVRSETPSPTAATELPTDELVMSATLPAGSSASNPLTASGRVAGTPAYMAPEQRAGQPPDARADQYALCVSLVEALDGRRPPPGVARDTLIAFVSERRPRETELDALCGVLARGLAADPRRRFPDTGALADALERTLSSRELESAATMSAAELPPALGSGPYSDPGLRSDTGPRSDAGPRSDTGPRSDAGLRSDAGTGPRSDAGPRSKAGTGPRASTAPRAAPEARPSTAPRAAPDPRSPTQPASRLRRIAPLAIAGLAAAAGVIAVLLGARALSKKSPRSPDGAGSAIAESPAPAAPRAEPLGPGSAAAPAPAPTAGSSGSPAPPAGAPIDPPRAPAAKTVAVAPPAAPGAFADLSSFTLDVQKYLRLHDGRACKRLIAGLPGNIHPTAKFGVESLSAYCEMMAGDCAGGTARLVRAHTAQGMAPQPAIFVEQYCPIEGPLETRLARLRSQAAAHTMGSAMDLAWCDALVPHAKQAAGEASTGPQRGIASFALHQLARCLGSAGRCDEARALWSLSNTVDESNKFQKPDLGPQCAAASADLAAAESYADPTPLLQSLTAALRGRDVRACQKLVATPLPNVHPGQKHSIELLQGQCEMLSGNCAAGTARLSRIGPNASGPPIDPTIRSAWLDSNVNMYCSIVGALDARVARLYAQMDAFTTRDSGNIAWCDALIPTAKTIAGEIATAAHKRRTGFVLQRLAQCVARVGRCDQGHELWTLATQIDPSTPAAPALGARCP